jgi:hypothetical protein
METAPPPHVIDAERLQDGVIITFEDGKTAVYSDSLLHRFFSQAQELQRIEDILAYLKAWTQSDLFQIALFEGDETLKNCAVRASLLCHPKSL